MPVSVAVTLSTYATTGSAVRLRAYTSANATADEQAMTESPAGSGQFLYTSTLSLTDNAGPYTWEARVVTAQTQVAFDASTNVARTRGLLGYVVNGRMLDSTADMRGINGLLPQYAPYPFSVSPILAQSSAADPPAKRIEVSQYSTPLYPFTCIDATGNAIDLSGKTVRFVAGTDDGVTLASTFKYETGGSGITINGTGNNVASVQFAAVDTAAPRTLRFWLWNITDKQLLAKGTLDVLAAVQSYP